MFRIFASILERKQPEGIHLSVGCLILIFSTVVSRCAIFLWQLGPVQSMVSFVMDCCLRLIWFYFSTWRNPTISAANIYICLYIWVCMSLHDCVVRRAFVEGPVLFVGRCSCLVERKAAGDPLEPLQSMLTCRGLFRINVWCLSRRPPRMKAFHVYWCLFDRYSNIDKFQHWPQGSQGIGCGHIFLGVSSKRNENAEIDKMGRN